MLEEAADIAASNLISADLSENSDTSGSILRKLAHYEALKGRNGLKRDHEVSWKCCNVRLRASTPPFDCLMCCGLTNITFPLFLHD